MVNLIDIILISESRAFHYCCLNVLRELLLHNNVVVEVFFQIFSALIASVTIINCENLYFRPIILWNLVMFSLWLNDVENNRYSVFIWFSNQPNVSVCCERPHNSELFRRSFSILERRKSRSRSYLQEIILGLIKLKFLLFFIFLWYILACTVARTWKLIRWLLFLVIIVSMVQITSHWLVYCLIRRLFRPSKCSWTTWRHSVCTYSIFTWSSDLRTGLIQIDSIQTFRIL